MTPRRIKRHYDFRIDVGTLAANSQQIVVNGVLPLDAPFVLKARAARCQYQPSGAPNPGQTLMDGFAWKFAGPDEQYYSQDLIPWNLESYQYGQVENGLWLQNPIIYPPGATVQAVVKNNSANSIPGVQLYFRGYQLFAPGQIASPTYPAKMATLPYIIPSGPGSPLVPGNYNALSALLQPTDTQRLLIVNAPPDSDWVLRSAQCVSPSAQGSGDPYPLEVHVTLMDWTQKPYSNLPVHVDILFGQYPGFLSTATGVVGANGWQPGLFTPEIYVQKNQFLYYNISRADAYLSGFGLTPLAENFYIGWKGAKVYAQ